MRAPRLMAALAATAVLATACGSSGSTSDTASTGGAMSSTGAGQSDTAAASCNLPDGADDKGSQSVSGSQVTITAGDLFFDPTCVTGLDAGTVTVTITNKGASLHNIQVADQNIDTDIPAGETVTVDVDLSSGPVQFVCKYHETSGMVGELVPA